MYIYIHLYSVYIYMYCLIPRVPIGTLCIYIDRKKLPPPGGFPIYHVP